MIIRLSGIEIEMLKIYTRHMMFRATLVSSIPSRLVVRFHVVIFNLRARTTIFIMVCLCSHTVFLQHILVPFHSNYQ